MNIINNHSPVPRIGLRVGPRSSFVETAKGIMYYDLLIYLYFHFVFQARALMRNMLHLRMFWMHFAYDDGTVSICLTWPNFELQRKTEFYHLTMDVKLCLYKSNLNCNVNINYNRIPVQFAYEVVYIRFKPSFFL